MRGAHDGSIWALAWHPAGHLLTSAGADHCAKFWARTRPGDPWRDRSRAELEAGAASLGGEGAHAGGGQTIAPLLFVFWQWSDLEEIYMTTQATKEDIS